MGDIDCATMLGADRLAAVPYRRVALRPVDERACEVAGLAVAAGFGLGCRRWLEEALTPRLCRTL